VKGQERGNHCISLSGRRFHRPAAGLCFYIILFAVNRGLGETQTGLHEDTSDKHICWLGPAGLDIHLRLRVPGQSLGKHRPVFAGIAVTGAFYPGRKDRGWL